MSVTEFFTFPLTRRRMYTGPLSPHIDEFTERLKQQGYSRRSICTKIRAVARFSRWLQFHHLDAHDVDADRRMQFLAYHKRTGGWTSEDPSALRAMEVLLHERGIVQILDAAEELSEGKREAKDFQTYLSENRGLSAKTARNYARLVMRFLSECFANEEVRFEALNGTDVIGFVQRHAHEHSHSHAQLMVKALRAFLRYLHHHGRISNNLATCVPSVAAWSMSGLPAYLSSGQVERVLDQCDRQTAVGRRDYAMLQLFARLGLRAGEVAALTLDGIDWASGYLEIRSKGGQWTHMPLPHEVGAAIADYVVNGRPACSDRRLFIRAHAPRTGFDSSSSVSAVASRALARAGIDTPRRGAHLFRHTLATEMLRQGASLTEIGQLLRHRHPDTTRLYAKVDLPALRKLALPWPGGAQ